MLLKRLGTLCFISLFSSTFLSNDTWAQSEATARVGEHKDYSRIVFQWDKAPSYKVTKNGTDLRIDFDVPKTLDIEAPASLSEASVNIQAVQAKNGDVSLSIPDGSTFRHFKIGQRIVVDIYDPEGVPASYRADKKQDIKTPAPTPSPSVQVRPRETIQEQVDAGKQVVVDTVEAMPVKALTPVDIIPEEPHVITLTTTRKVGMAIFRRAGYLWLILDDPSVSVPPQLSGPEKSQFSDFERFTIPGGIAYRMPLNDNFNVYAEGGGLLWRVVLTPNTRRRNPVDPKTSFDGSRSFGGGSLFWPITQPRKKLQMQDPVVGDTLHIITVEDAAQYIGEPRKYVDMQTLDSTVGMVLSSWVDDLAVGMNTQGVTVTRNGGLSLSSNRDTAPILLKEKVDEEDTYNEYGEAPPLKDALSRIFSFKNWQMGGPNALEENRRVIMVSMSGKDNYGQVEDLLTLTKLNLANNRGIEALGLLRIAENELAGIEQSPEFISLRGAAGALAGQYDVAIPNLFDKELEKYGEIDIWKSFALAGLEDWRQSHSVMPDNLDLVAEYPPQIRYPMALNLAEASLRGGNIDRAESLLALIDMEDKNATAPIKAAYNYLVAEADRQRGDYDAATEAWTKLSEGRDDYYRAKSGLSLTRLQLEEKKITPAEAINRLEALRYAWRGDELETLINYRLGQVYIENKDYLKGLSVLRNAVSLSPDTVISEDVTTYMTDTFRSLFTDGTLEEISTLDAVSIYDEFKELTPAGSVGDIFVQKLAENLVNVDLLGRAGALLEHQLIHRLKGEEAVRVGLRLAAIRLLDNKPDGALRALDLSDQAIDTIAQETKEPYSQERAEGQLLRARALSQLNRTGEAVEMLDRLAKRRGNDLNIARLKADMAWVAGRWDDAAEAFQDLIMGENISFTRPVTDAQRDLIMNRAIALNLSGNRVALANLRERYGDSMKQTQKARMFELVTRPRQMGLLGSRDSVESLMSEVDLFGDFLENYRKMEAQ